MIVEIEVGREDEGPMSVDRCDDHYEDAGSYGRASRHIVVYLMWAADRGLASKEIDAVALRRSPVKHFLDHCDGKLWDIDFNDAGRAVTKKIYMKYLNAVDARGQQLGISPYAIPANKASKEFFFAVLDELRAAAERKRRRKPARRQAPERSRRKESPSARTASRGRRRASP